MRRKHNPFGVVTVAIAGEPRRVGSIRFAADAGGWADMPPLVPCVDCGGLVDKIGEPPYLHDDCRCIRETGQQCDFSTDP